MRVASQCVVYMLLAVYLDKVLPDRMGVRLPPWYPLLPSYWNPSKVCHAFLQIAD